MPPVRVHGTTTTDPVVVEEVEVDVVPRPRWRLQAALRLDADRLALLCVLAAIAPIVVATIRAAARDWVAVGDNGYFLIRSRDVLTEHHPLLGTWTSASQTVGINVNNPGPLYFDLFALPVKLGGDVGLAIAVGLLNVASVLGIALVARRQAGARGVAAAMLAAAGLAWTMGSELLFDPWQPHGLLFPFLLFLMLVWSLGCGDVVLLPWAAGVASLIVQTHLGYALVVPALAVSSAAVVGARLWRARRSDAEAWPAQRGRALRTVGVTGLVGLICWAQPVFEQLFGRGDGNLSRLADAAGAPQSRVGLSAGSRIAAKVLVLPPWWGRPSMRESFGYFSVLDELPSGAETVAGLLVLAGFLAGGFLLARRHQDAPGLAAVVTAGAVVAVTLIGAGNMTVAHYGVAAHHVRWLWPVAVFLMFVLALVGLTRPGDGRMARLGLLGVTLATLVLGLATLPSTNMRVGPSADADSIPTIRALLPQLRTLQDETGVLIDIRGLRFAEPFSVPVMAELQRLGVPFYVDDPGMVRQLGDARTWEGQASVRLFLREGREAIQTEPGARRVAFVDNLSPDERGELADIQDELRSFIADGGLRLTAEAQADAANPNSPNVDAGGVSDAELRDADHLMSFGSASSPYGRKLVYLVVAARLEVSDRWEPVLDRYAELQQGADRITVAVFVESLEARG